MFLQILKLESAARLFGSEFRGTPAGAVSLREGRRWGRPPFAGDPAGYPSRKAHENHPPALPLFFLSRVLHRGAARPPCTHTPGEAGLKVSGRRGPIRAMSKHLNIMVAPKGLIEGLAVTEKSPPTRAASRIFCSCGHLTYIAEL